MGGCQDGEGKSLAEAGLGEHRLTPSRIHGPCTLVTHSRGIWPAGLGLVVGLDEKEGKTGAFHQDMEPQGLGSCQEAGTLSSWLR